MIINFPFSPKIDQVYTQGNLSWQWNGIKWMDYTSSTENLIVNNSFTLTNQTTYTSATAGLANVLPANPAGYLSIELNGVMVKVPYYL